MDGYVDLWNSGCNDTYGLTPSLEIVGDWDGTLTLCGTAGWFDDGFRDTDWFFTHLSETGIMHWALDAEQETYGFLLGPQDCASVGVLESFLADPCQPNSLSIQGNPGDVVWLWVGSPHFYPPAGFLGHEFTYVATFSGLEIGPVQVEAFSFDKVKSLYR